MINFSLKNTKALNMNVNVYVIVQMSLWAQ